jgi:hypothetical protein
MLALCSLYKETWKHGNRINAFKIFIEKVTNPYFRVIKKTSLKNQQLFNIQKVSCLWTTSDGWLQPATPVTQAIVMALLLLDQAFKIVDRVINMQQRGIESVLVVEHAYLMKR